ncbi:C4-dicarboxylate transporter/malic acid transport protein [Ceraceosorus guamensis]|uniref:C4-dicarboxylate transporter/malic acid transport protein n=1 Tax=Ceraceosorus guamensis TaxID=1522189 RepID=A0A316W308_9BASI|nr:C4-dicarboxylate transporter/malic acid transport protein [Ceraceosorus guamensis]PWN42045.1 C4-dicarboxylate transporter/malic acid transport protein [Ceraceosorus guamensis]
MSTGGMAVVIGQQPHTFRGLQTIGKVVFIFDLVLLVTLITLTVQRFVRKPELLWRSLRNPGECLFLPAVWLSVADIVICMQLYASSSTGNWLIVTIRVLFWFYVATVLIMASLLYLDLFTARRMTNHDIIPAWLLPMLPVMLTGTVAGSIASSQPPGQAIAILVAGLTCQGLGFWASIAMYGPFITRLMKIGLPAPNLRPGLMIAVSPPAFTALALIDMSQAMPAATSYFSSHSTASETLQVIALATGIFLWALSFWWFVVTVGAILLGVKKMEFHLVWYGLLFPNVGWTVSTISIGKALGSNAVTWVSTAMSLLLITAYLFVLLMHARAIWRGGIMWPGKDEDKDT